MALGPQRLVPDDEAAAKNVEVLIDKVITARPGKTSVGIRVKDLGVTLDLWYGQLRQKYLDAGWESAEWVSDPEGGDFINLEA